MPKSRGGGLAVGTYLQRGSAPPPGGIVLLKSFPELKHEALRVVCCTDWSKRTAMIALSRVSEAERDLPKGSC